MARTVTASEANQNFSRLLSEAIAGETITITRRGKPVVKLVPAEDELKVRRAAALKKLLARLEKMEPVVIGPWTREELYEREPW